MLTWETGVTSSPTPFWTLKKISPPPFFNNPIFIWEPWMATLSVKQITLMDILLLCFFFFLLNLHRGRLHTKTRKASCYFSSKNQGFYVSFSEYNESLQLLVGWGSLYHGNSLPFSSMFLLISLKELRGSQLAVTVLTWARLTQNSSFEVAND